MDLMNSATSYDELSYARLSRLLGWRPKNREEAIRILSSRPYPSHLLDLTPWLERDPQTVVDQLGIVVPEGYPIHDYLVANIRDYIPVIVRSRVEPLPPLIQSLARIPHISAILDQYTDKELFDQLGIYVPYRSRRQLIERLAKAIRGPGVFAVPPGCLAYGNILDYSCLTPEEARKMLIEPTPWESGGRSEGNVHTLKELAIALGYISSETPVARGY
jgi:hypothetical protein